MLPRLPSHWEFPITSAIVCVACGAIIEAAAPFSPLADIPTRAAEISPLSVWILRYASVATESAVLVAITLIAGVVILSQRIETAEGRLQLALRVTTIGFTIALAGTLASFIALFVIPNAGP